ncbi:MAG: phosphoribosylformylglycinamidine synthase, partial [Patescibacteria group bacterium]
TLTAETHCHPTFIEPFEGSATGTGGRLRDNHAVGRGGLVIAGALGIFTGNLCVPGYPMPWEKEEGWKIPEEFAAPLQIMLRGTDGAYAYGNCFGEPTVLGVTRTFGQTVSGQRRGWYKPILYTAGWGQMDHQHRKKGKPLRNMLVVQVGGKAFRIGMGGGSGSSLSAGAISAKLAFDSVQRGDPEMENRVNRVIRACVALGRKNPIVSAHDYGAGGACNALTEIAHPAGARIELRKLPVGDRTLSVLEIWGNEAQERDGFLIRSRDWKRFRAICDREKVECAIVGRITGDGWLVLHDETDGSKPVEVPLDRLLEKLPRKTFHHQTIKPVLQPLHLPGDLTVEKALERVLRLPAVASKRFLTTKVDRSVSGLIAQQQCIGPNQLPLSDFAAVAQTYFPQADGSTPGVAISLGEQPLKGFISPEKMARLAVAEALLNLVGAKITRIKDIKMSANWMWAAKRPGEGPRLIAAAQALRDYLIPLGMAIDGGKDSLSMSARLTGPDNQPQEAKAPGELILSYYAPMLDVGRKITCDLKQWGNALVYIDLAGDRKALGGSALAQCFKQTGDDCPDACEPARLKQIFELVQQLVQSGGIVSVHDVSDGGLITTLLEMAFAGNRGVYINLDHTAETLPLFFSEGPGLVLEFPSWQLAKLLDQIRGIGVYADQIGKVGETGGPITVAHNNRPVLNCEMTKLRAIWEETSSRLDALQANPECVSEEARVNRNPLAPPPYRLTFSPAPTPQSRFRKAARPNVAVVREQGTNGDAEMIAALQMAGFKTWDVTMSDLVAGRAVLDERFRGVIFPGGFSFGDVLDAGKGWAGVIRFNPKVREQFERFRQRPDTFSFGVCNGCQLMALMGWVPGLDYTPEVDQPRFVQNRSRRFESRWVTVAIQKSPAMMLSEMAGSTLGVWVAHGEGYLHFPSSKMIDKILGEKLAPLRYVDRKNRPTETYPFNPNGSPKGIAGLCSPDGRHLAMMPHPERAFLLWQWAWLPPEFQKLEASPWLRMFQNAYHWCVS